VTLRPAPTALASGGLFPGSLAGRPIHRKLAIDALRRAGLSAVFPSYAIRRLANGDVGLARVLSSALCTRTLCGRVLTQV
jgi:hypothetical protein